MEVIRVLQIMPAMNCGGMENFIMNVYRHIDRQKIQFDFLYHYADDCFFDEEIRALGGRIYKLSVRNDNNVLRYCRQLDAFFAKHTEYNVIHGHYSGFGMFYNYYAKKHGIKVRAGHGHSALYEKGLLGQLDKWMSKPFKYLVTDHFACSETVGQLLFGKKPFSTLKNGVCTKRFAFDATARAALRTQYGISAQERVLGHVGRFSPVKNHAFLLEAFALLAKERSDVKLLLVGEGDLQAQMQEKAQQLQVADQVLFVGAQYDTAPFYSVMDAFVLPSVFEGFPVALVEAQTNGLPCYVSDTLDTSCAIEDSVHFLPLEPSTWVRALAQVDGKRCDTRAAQRMAEQGYDILQVAKWLEDFYQRENQYVRA